MPRPSVRPSTSHARSLRATRRHGSRARRKRPCWPRSAPARLNTSGAASLGPNLPQDQPAARAMQPSLSFTRRLGRASAVRDVLAHGGGLHLDLRDVVLDHVADRDDADERAVFDHRQMAEAPGRHHGHDLIEGVALLAADDRARHALGDGPVQALRAVASQHADDVTLGHNAGDLAARAHDHHRADALGGQLVGDVEQRRGGARRGHRPTFLSQYRRNIHDVSSLADVAAQWTTARTEPLSGPFPRVTDAMRRAVGIAIVPSTRRKECPPTQRLAQDTRYACASGSG